VVNQTIMPACPAGEFLTSFDGINFNCISVSVPPCPEGSLLMGVDRGQPICISNVKIAGNLQVGGNAQFSSYVGTMGYSATSGYPFGWRGGFHTWDVYAEGSVGAGAGGSLEAKMNSYGDIWSSHSVSTDGKMGIGTTNPRLSLDVSNKTDAIGMPAGRTSEQPPSPTQGVLRFNTDTRHPEYFDGSVWQELVEKSSLAPPVADAHQLFVAAVTYAANGAAGWSTPYPDSNTVVASLNNDLMRGFNWIYPANPGTATSFFTSCHINDQTSSSQLSYFGTHNECMFATCFGHFGKYPVLAQVSGACTYDSSDPHCNGSMGGPKSWVVGISCEYTN
jgi:hypothetical protein